MKASAIEKGFRGIFEYPPEAVYFAPGRVNLIGEHIDYNGGLVMPAAISTGTWFAVARNRTGHLRIHSRLFGEQRSIELVDLPDIQPCGQWVDYIVGMSQQLIKLPGGLAGADVFVDSDMPQNSGLSSSASFSVGFGFALADLFDLEIGRVELALAARTVENDFVGVSCGIMDQFAVAMGKAGHCLVLDCDSLDYELLPMNLAGHEIVVANSMVPRRLSESKYNLRRSECEQALEILQKKYEVRQLCDLDVAQVESCIELRRFDVLRRRALHAASENARVRASAADLKQGQLAEFGEHMNSSHDSLRDDFEVSCPELDLLVDTAQSLPGVLGSRMTGAGFGGCTVSIVESGAIPDFSARLSKTYGKNTPYNVQILAARPSDGVNRVS